MIINHLNGELSVAYREHLNMMGNTKTSTIHEMIHDKNTSTSIKMRMTRIFRYITRGLLLFEIIVIIIITSTNKKVEKSMKKV